MKTNLNHGPASRNAFTLTELLAVMAIFAVLAVLVLSTMSSMRDSAKTAKCASNMRQLALGCIAYSGDNGNRLVPVCTPSPYRTWRALISPYINSAQDSQMKIFRCPSDEINSELNISAGDRTQGLRPTSYGLNSYAMTLKLHQYTDASQPGRKSLAIERPAGAILLVDMGHVQNAALPLRKWTERTGGGSYGYARFPVDPHFGGDSWNVYPRHAGVSANAAFYDGHVELVDIEKQINPYTPGSQKCLYDNQ